MYIINWGLNEEQIYFIQVFPPCIKALPTVVGLYTSTFLSSY